MLYVGCMHVNRCVHVRVVYDVYVVCVSRCGVSVYVYGVVNPSLAQEFRLATAFLKLPIL